MHETIQVRHLQDGHVMNVVVGSSVERMIAREGRAGFWVKHEPDTLRDFRPVDQDTPGKQASRHEVIAALPNRIDAGVYERPSPPRSALDGPAIAFTAKIAIALLVAGVAVWRW